MIGKILALPFVLLKNAVGLIFWIIRAILGLIFGIVKFIFGHVFGTIFGALAGLLLGQKHIGIKWFGRKKKKKKE